MSSTIAETTARPRAGGKFLWVGGEKLYVRGVTYGTFRPGADGLDVPPPAVVAEDFAAMAAANVNTVRTYTPPPEWLLDQAAAAGLRVLVGLPWEQHVAFLESRSSARAIERRVNEAARACAGHPALLGFAVGNEIPAPIARWHGRRPVEGFIERLYEAAKDADPGALVTYVNFPTTEYLQLPFLDFACFNVYLEQRDTLAAYLARLHNLVGERPLVMAEIGLDSRRNGVEQQAETLSWQLDAVFESGCAGACVFAWTDEWHRGGHDVDDWDFGLVDRQRRPKPALGAVEDAYETLAIHRPERDWPRISVVVCSYNGERWLPGCFEALRRVDYPNWEVLVVSDGSTDRTDDLVREAGHRLVRAERNGGLSAARNLGMEAATGEIVAYLDDDARPDPDWLRYLALHFGRHPHAAVGGPNVPPPEDGAIARCVAASPGGPIHVLVGDDVAEHVPGCNLAVRRDRMEAIGGFDSRYWIAGDDVDYCWRVQEAGDTIGFSPAAMVWHHRRSSIRTYFRQQYMYGRAEALLHEKWPERYNRLGHLTWAGRVYGRGLRGSAATPPRSARIGYGSWGSELFQSIYSPPGGGTLRWLPALPESYLVLAMLAVLTLHGLAWTPLLLAAAPLLALGVLAVTVTAIAGARSSDVVSRTDPFPRRLALRSLTAGLHALQPLARLAGRLRGGLSPWRRHGQPALKLPWPRQTQLWSERWFSVDDWLSRVEAGLHDSTHAVARGSAFDRWDLEVRGGLFGIVRVLCVVEEHGAGKQLARFRSWPRASRAAIALVALFSALSAGAILDDAWVAAGLLATMAAVLVAVAAVDCASAAGTMARAIRSALPDDEPLIGPAPRPAVLHPALEHRKRGERALRAASERRRAALAEERSEAGR